MGWQDSVYSVFLMWIKKKSMWGQHNGSEGKDTCQETWRTEFNPWAYLEKEEHKLSKLHRHATAYLPSPILLLQLLPSRPRSCPPPQFPPLTQQWWEREIKNKPKGQIKLVFKRISQHSLRSEDPGSSQPSWSPVWPQWAILRSSSSNRGAMLCLNRLCDVCCIPGLESGVSQPFIAVLLSVF